LESMLMHSEIATKQAKLDGIDYGLLQLCVKSGGTCVSSTEGACQCLMTSILRQWNYDLATLHQDNDRNLRFSPVSGRA
jgi:hypothetical protein